MTFESSLDRLLKFPNPYPGLRPFESDEGFLLFGRDDQTAALINRIARHRFLALVGVSGSGKSSLVLAGLIPALRRGVVPGSAGVWREVVMRPGAAPIDNLAAALSEARFRVENLRRSSYGIVNTAAQLKGDENLLLIVDQFEELFRYKDESLTTSESAARRAGAAVEASEFVQLLLTATRERPPIYVVITMRSEYLGDCAEFRGFAEALNATQYLIPRLTRDQRQAAIEGPLGRLPIDPNLVQRILNETGDEPSDLPLLQHTLMRTWSRWHAAGADRTSGILETHYETAGGIADALNQHAEELLGAEVARANPGIPEQIFRRLTARGRSQRERRDPTRLKDLWAVCGAETPERRRAVTAVIDLFRVGEATFLTPRRDDLKSDTYIDITHESLIKKWKLLATEWFPAEQKQASQLRELHDRAVRWERGGEVLHGIDLREAEDWDKARNRQPAWAEHHLGGADPAVIGRLLDASRKVKSKREKQERLRRSLLGYALIVSLAAALLVGWIAVRARNDARTGRAAKLAAQAALMRTSEPNRLDLSLLLAVASMKLSPTAEADQLIREIGGLLGTPVARLDHTSMSPIWAVAIEGKKVATLPEGSELHLWELETGRKLGAINASARINAFAISYDGELVATAAANGVVTISRIEGTDPVELTRLIHPESVNHVSFSRDSRSIATAGDDGLVRVWEVAGQPVETRKPTETFRHKASVKLVAFGPRGLLASTGDDGAILLWQTANEGQPARTAVVATIANDEPLSSLRNFAVPEFQPAVIAATGYNNWIKMWAAPFREKTPMNAQPVESPGGRPKFIGTTSLTSLECARYPADVLEALRNRSNTDGAFGPPPSSDLSRSIASCNHVIGLYNGVSRVWDVSESLDAGPGMIERARFIHGGSALAASVKDGFAVVGDSTGVARIWKFESNGPNAGTERNVWAGVSEDGRRALSLEHERIAWHDLVTGKRTFLPAGAPPSNAINRVTFDRAGGRLAIEHKEQILIHDLARDSTVSGPLQTVEPIVDSTVSGLLRTAGPMQFEADSILVPGSSDFVVINASTAKLAWTMKPLMGAHYGEQPILSPDGRTVVTWEIDGGLSAWSAKDGQASLLYSRPDLHVRAIAFNRRSGAIAVCQSRDNHLLVLDPSTGKESTSPVVLPSPCAVVTSDPANDRLAVAAGGAVLLVEGNRPKPPLLHVEMPRHLRFSSDGRLLAVVSNGYTLMEVIEVATGDRRAKIPVRLGMVADAWSRGVTAFSPDASQLVLSGWTFNLSPQAVIADACRRVRQGALDEDVPNFLGTDAPTVSECLAAAMVP